MRVTGRASALLLAIVLIASCATGRAMRNGREAADRGDWDTAVAYYREALAREPGNIEVRVALQRAMREAATAHLARARTLEEQEQWAGAAAEYRLAAELEPSNALAAMKAAEIERRIRDLREAAMPQPEIEELRRQAQLTSPIPQLDPRTIVPALRFPNASVGEILKTISDLTGINITYDRDVTAMLNQRNPPLDVQNVPLEEVLNQVLSANQLTFKVTNPRTIFVYQDTLQKRQQYEDVYTQTFYLSNADASEIVQILNTLLSTGSAIRPIITQNKTANSIVVRATAPVMKVIEGIIQANDKQRAEVLIDVEILEVSRTRMKELGIDLSQWALGFTFSPELAPPNTASAPNVFPGMPPPINLNTMSGGISARDFYMTAPTALIRLLESDQKTRLLAKPQLRGREGDQLTLQLGEDVPVIRTSITPIAAGGVPTQPQQSYEYRPVGVNLTITPQVTYDGEIILAPIMVDRSALGPFIDIAGTSIPTFIKRTATVSMRLRDGESNLLAGLVSSEDRETARSLPGIARIPILRSLFGSTNRTEDETDVIMIVTPHIVRGRGLTSDDLRPTHIGTQNNIGAGTVPTLISPDAPLPPPPGGVGQPPTGPPPAGAQPPPATPPTGAEPPPPTGRDPKPNIVPIQPVTDDPAVPAKGASTIRITTPGTEFQVGGGPYPAPITVSDVSQLSTVTITVIYDPALLRATTVTQGTFMSQGGVTPTFAPKIDEASGRVDIAISRGPDNPGASVVGTQLLGAVVFQAIRPGSADITITAVATDAAGQPIQLQPVPAKVTIK